MSSLFVGLASLMAFLVYAGSVIIHIWTLVIAYNSSGIAAAILSFIFPVISQLYWCYYEWKISGLDSPFIQWIIVLLLIWIFSLTLAIAGRFLENKKTRDEASASVAGDYIDANYPIGFGGWLYLVALGAIIAFGQSLFYLLDTLMPLYTSARIQEISEYSPTLAFAVLFETVFNLFNLSILLLAAYQCFRLKKAFSKTMILFYLSALIFGFIYILIISIVPEIDKRVIEEQWGQLFKALITCVIWIPYMIKSKRVRNTFIY
ncbi:DUF2569 domain-containing protein [Paenibacillus naphthalenovorans]|uniref:DUF2569 domain-containing protein n=1 Tax=Paenibacillus naphthalenovorans TaxID=162209 RepID=UPI00088D4189|nr:DUF2569 domain-containing protein [Paenibacillus naphthalenovorans]SDJ62343.1 Protein of unknown function [Paenibacillus naphthalenovorans]